MSHLHRNTTSTNSKILSFSCPDIEVYTTIAYWIFWLEKLFNIKMPKVFCLHCIARVCPSSYLKTSCITKIKYLQQWKFTIECRYYRSFSSILKEYCLSYSMCWWYFCKIMAGFNDIIKFKKLNLMNRKASFYHILF